MAPFLAARTMKPAVNFPKTKLNRSVQLLVMPQNLNNEGSNVLVVGAAQDS